MNFSQIFSSVSETTIIFCLFIIDLNFYPFSFYGAVVSTQSYYDMHSKHIYNF